VIDDLIAKGRAKESERDAILSRVTATADYNALKDCDLIIEAVFEDRKVKAETYAKAQPLLKSDAILPPTPQRCRSIRWRKSLKTRASSSAFISSRRSRR